MRHCGAQGQHPCGRRRPWQASFLCLAVMAAHGPGLGRAQSPTPAAPASAADAAATPDDGPAGIVFVAGKAPLNTTPNALQSKWDINGSRAFFEHDTPTPAALGHRLYALVPARPETKPRLLVDAGTGVLGSPAVSYDGAEIIFSMAPAGEKYFHLYRISSDGRDLQRLTEGVWHDYEPAVLPDGRIVFASTRIGSRDEYHGNTARSLFVMSADRRRIEPLTWHIVGDSEPTVMADGRIAFVRSDNFFERAKVETQIHGVRPDGTGGEVLLGPNRGAIAYDPAVAAEDPADWLRNYGFGCPAPLPDGRVACISHQGLIVTSQPDERNSGSTPPDHHPVPCDVPLYDISPLPDGRLLCSTLTPGELRLLDIDSGRSTLLHQFEGQEVHSPVYLGPRPKPPYVAQHTRSQDQTATDVLTAGQLATGELICQNLFSSRQTEADWARVKAVRVLLGDALTTRSARHPYDHIGVEGVELGTVALASDGSFHLRVPADRALALQAVDAEGRPVVSELSWIYVRPGERRSCTGCHQLRDQAPAGAPPLATRVPPADLTAMAAAHRYRANNAANGGVLNLQMDRFREAASIDLYTQELLQDDVSGARLPPGRQAAVARWSKVVASPRAVPPAERVAAAERLAIYRQRSAVPALVDALRDDHREVRRSAALALAACGDREAIEPLLRALLDSDSLVAQSAGVALEHLTGHQEAWDPYAGPAAQQAGYERWQGWRDAHDWEAVEAGLIEQVDQPDPTAAQLAIEALGHSGGPAGAARLRSVVEAGRADSLRTQLAAIRALGYLQDEAAIPLLGRLLVEHLQPTPFEPLKSHEFGWAQQPVQLAAAAAEALGWIGTPAAEDVLLAAVPQMGHFWYYTYRNGDHDWLEGCHSSLPHYRVAEALDAIGSSRAAAVVPALLRSVPIDTDRGLLYENDSYETVVARVVHRSGLADATLNTCLAVLGATDAVPSPLAELREAVVATPPAVSVGGLEPAARAAQLLSMLAVQPKLASPVRAAWEWHRSGPPSRERSWTCFFLARTLGKLRDRDAVPSLIAALDEDPKEASFGVPDPPNVFLHEAMTPLYRAAAADALGRIGSAEAVPALLRAAADFDNAMDVRHAAARSLKALRAHVPADQLSELARNYPEATTQRTLLEACAPLP